MIEEDQDIDDDEEYDESDYNEELNDSLYEDKFS
jgi:hypothetical protein